MPNTIGRRQVRHVLIDTNYWKSFVHGRLAVAMGDPEAAGEQALDEKTLQEIADMTGGQYFLARDKDRLQDIYTELDKLESIEYEEEENKPVKLLYYYPLATALVLLLVIALVLGVTNALVATKKGKEAYV